MAMAVVKGLKTDFVGKGLEKPTHIIAPRLVSELASEGASGRLLCQVRGVIRASIF